MSLLTSHQGLSTLSHSSQLLDSTTVTESEAADDSKLVFIGDILLLAIFSFFVVLSLRRAYARFSCAPEWLQGYILRSTGPDKWRDQDPAVSSGNRHAEKGIDMKAKNSQKLRSRRHVVQHKDSPRSTAFPPHVPTMSSILYPIGSSLERRLMLGFSVGQAVILGVYAIILQYESLYKSNLFTDPVRTGFVATAQLPFLFALAAKNNVMGGLIGFGYEKINYIHRFLGRAVTILLDIHTLGYVYQWTSDGTFVVNSRKPDIARSFVALACLNVMVLTSTALVRQKWYRLFFVSHVIGFVIFLPTVCSHKPVIIPYVLAAVIIYGIDHLIRLMKLRICTAHIMPFPELSVTHVRVPSLNAGWRAGQHVRLRVLSSWMGWWGWTENHPFTIASLSNTEDGLILMCKQAGPWTTKLYELAKASGYGDCGKGTGVKVKVMVEGPYGGPGYTVYASYSAAVFICGGSGISFGLSAVQELVQRHLEGTSRVEVIELIWIVQDPASLVPLIPLFTSISTASFLNISVYYTRATPGVDRIMKDCDHPRLSLNPGRPKINQVIDSVISRALSPVSGTKDSDVLSGVIVGACGPVGLGDEVSMAVRLIDSPKRKAVGGVEFYEEVFGW